MPIAHLTLELRIEHAQSLKDKRQVVRSLKDKLRAKFNVSVAELDEGDMWQRATIGVVSISGSKDYLTGLMQNVEREAFKVANNSLDERCVMVREPKLAGVFAIAPLERQPHVRGALVCQHQCEMATPGGRDMSRA